MKNFIKTPRMHDIKKMKNLIRLGANENEVRELFDKEMDKYNKNLEEIKILNKLKVLKKWGKRIMHKDALDIMSIEDLTREKQHLLSLLDDYKGRLTIFDRNNWEKERTKIILKDDINSLLIEIDNRDKLILDGCMKAFEDGKIKVEIIKN